MVHHAHALSLRRHEAIGREFKRVKHKACPCEMTETAFRVAQSGFPFGPSLELPTQPAVLSVLFYRKAHTYSTDRKVQVLVEIIIRDKKNKAVVKVRLDKSLKFTSAAPRP